MESSQRRSSLEFAGEWEEVETSAIRPSARCGHTVTMHGDFHTSELSTMLVCFGESSLSPERKYLNDLYLLDLETRHWLQIYGDSPKDTDESYEGGMCEYVRCGSSRPVARADHCACSFGQQLDSALVFGGKCEDTYLDDLIIIRHIPSAVLKSSLRKHKSSVTDYCAQHTAEVLREKANRKPVKIESLYLPNGPVGRRGSNLTQFDNGQFMLFGGQRGSLFLNDLWRLDLRKHGWTQLDVRGQIPQPRAYHSAFVDDEKKFFILGGVKDGTATPVPPDIYAFDHRKNEFFRLGGKDIAPGLERALSKGHHGSHFIRNAKDLVIYSPQNSQGFILGGNKKAKHCGKCVPIETFRSSDSTPKPRGTCRPATALIPGAVCPPSMKVYGCNGQVLDRLLVYGGYTPSTDGCCSSVRSLQFSTRPCRTSSAAHLGSGHRFQYTECDESTKENLHRSAAVARDRREKRRRILSDMMNHSSVSSAIGGSISTSSTAAVPFAVLDNGDSDMRDKSGIHGSMDIKGMSSPDMSQSSRMLHQHNNHHHSHRLSNVTPMRGAGLKGRGMAPVTPGSARSLSCSANGCYSGTMTNGISGNASMKRVRLTKTPVRKRHNGGTERLSWMSHKISDTSLKKLDGFDPELWGDSTSVDDNDELFWDPSFESTMSRLKKEIPVHIRVIREVLVKRSQMLSKLESMSDQSSMMDGSGSGIGSNGILPFMLKPHEFRLLIRQTKAVIKKEPTLIEIDPAVKIFGDIHGQLSDLMALFDAFGAPSLKTGDLSVYRYIFLGDFVDRGKQSLEVMSLLMSLKIQYPDRIYLIRGNHECKTMNDLYGFYEEIERRLVDAEDAEIVERIQESSDPKIKDLSALNRSEMNQLKQRVLGEKVELSNAIKSEMNTLFMHLPLSALIGQRILCVHGGIGQVPSIDKIASIPRPCQVQAELTGGGSAGDKGGLGSSEDGSDTDDSCPVQLTMEEQDYLIDILWSDPAETDQETGYQSNSRGVSCVFGSDIVREFCQNNDIDLIVRAHQVVIDGFEYFARGHLITVFSATNYCSQMDNAGAILCVDTDMRVVPKLVEARGPDDEPSQWVETSQPPSPMRGTGHTSSMNANTNHNNDEDDLDSKTNTADPLPSTPIMSGICGGSSAGVGCSGPSSTTIGASGERGGTSTLPSVSHSGWESYHLDWAL